MKISSWITLLTTLLCVGCAAIQVAQDYDPATDFSALQTFAWTSSQQAATGDPRIDSPLRDTRIRSAVETQLSTRGYRRADEAPQFRIQYQYLLQRTISAHGPTIGFGLGTGHYGRYGGVGIGTGTRVSEHDEGTLIIDFTAPDSNTLLWRGSGTHYYTEHKDPAKTTRDLDLLVQKILSQFPPGR